MIFYQFYCLHIKLFRLKTPPYYFLNALELYLYFKFDIVCVRFDKMEKRLISSYDEINDTFVGKVDGENGYVVDYGIGNGYDLPDKECPKCGTMFQIDETNYESIARQVRNKEFEKEIDLREHQHKQDKENAIELLPQAFAVIAQVGDTGRRVDALNKAFDTLYDKENHIMKLFTPSYNNPEYDPGYIKGYCKGLRENGGQYTHAAVWMMSALFKLSMEKDVDKQQRKELLEKGVMLFKDMLVPYRMRNEQLSVKYKAEPYVLSADIYSNEEHEGLAGWTWYTGSASWLWREILSCVFCMSFEGMKTDFPTLNFTENVFIVPFMLEGLNGVKIKIEESLIVVKYEKRGQERILHDGKDTGMKIKLQKGENEIVVWSK